jgi:hypothetical protein
MLFRVPEPLVNIAHFSEIVRKKGVKRLLHFGVGIAIIRGAHSSELREAPVCQIFVNEQF